jgi:hypothetical protein
MFQHLTIPRPGGSFGPLWHAVRVGLLAVLLLLASLVGVLHTSWGVKMVVNLVLRIANPWPGTSLTVAHARPGFLSGIELHGVALRQPGGPMRGSVDTLRVRYGLAELLGRPQRLRKVEIAGIHLVASQGADGSLDVLGPFAKPAPVDFALDHLEIRGGGLELRTRPVGPDSVLLARDLVLDLSDLRARETIRLALDTLTATLVVPAAPADTLRLALAARLLPKRLEIPSLSVIGKRTRVTAAGTLVPPNASSAAEGGTHFTLDCRPLAEPDIERFLPFLGHPGDVTLHLAARSEETALRATIDARSERGGRVTLDARWPQAGGALALRTDGHVEALDLGAMMGRRPDSLVVQASWAVDLAGADRDHLSGPFTLRLDHTRAGSVVLDEARLEGRLNDGRAAFDVRASGAGASIGVSGKATPFDRAVGYELAGTLSLPPIELSKPARASWNTPVVFAGDVRFRLEGRGFQPDSGVADAAIELLPDPSKPSLVGPGRFDASLAEGGIRYRLDVAVASGTLRAHGEASLGRTPVYRLAEGSIAGVHVAAFLGDTTASRLDARFRASGRGTHPDSLSAVVELDSLLLGYGDHHARVGAGRLQIDGGSARIEALSTVDGARVEAHGFLASLAHPRDAQVKVDFRDLDLASVLGDTLFASHAAGRLEARLQGPDLASVLGRTDAAVVAATHGRARLELERSTLRAETLNTLELNAVLDGGELRADGRLESTLGWARLDATARPFDESRWLRVNALKFEELRPAAFLGGSAPRAELQGVLSGVLVRTLSGAAEGTADLRLDGSRLNGVTFDNLSVRSHLAHDHLDGLLLARAGTDTVRIAIAGPAGGRLVATGELKADSLAAVLGIESLGLGAGLTFDIEGRLPGSAGLSALDVGGRVDGWARLGVAPPDTVSAAFRIGHGLARVSNLDLRGRLAHVEASGQIALPWGDGRDTTSFRIKGTLGEIQTLAPWLKVRDLAATGGGFELSASGPAAATTFRGELALRHPHVDEIWADSLHVDFMGAVRETTVSRLVASVAARSLVAWPLRSRDVDATLALDGGKWIVDAREIAEGDRRRRIALQLERQADGWRGRLDRVELRHGDRQILLEKPVPFLFGARMSVGDIVLLENGLQRLRAHGRLEPGGEVDVAVRVDSLNLGELVDVYGPTTLGGQLSVEGTLTGRRERPVLTASLVGYPVAGRGKPARVTANLTWADSVLDVSAGFEQTADNRIAMSARIPLTLTFAHDKGAKVVSLAQGPFIAQLEAKRFDLSWFGPLVSPRVLRQPRGWLEGNVHAEGDPLMPMFSGSLALAEARAELPSLGVQPRKGEALLTFRDRTITLERLHVASKGVLEATGTATFRGRGRRILDLRGHLHNFVPTNTLHGVVTLSGDLAVSGAMEAPVLGGRLTVDQTTFYAKGGTATRGEAVALDWRDRLDLQEHFGVRVSPEAERRAALVDSLGLNLDLAIGDNVWVRSRSDPVVALEMEGALHAGKSAGGPLNVRGTIGVRTGRSYLSFVGRRFDITRANVDLPGPVDSARVRLEALYLSESGGTSPNVNVTARVTVDAHGSETDLRSEPYMDPPALLNYLATGQMQGGAFQTGTAYGLAVGTALAAVGGSAGRSLGLDVVQVTMDAYGGQTLSAGSYVDPRIYLGFRQPVMEAQTTGRTTSSTPTEFEIEYAATRKLLLNLQGSSEQYRFLLKRRLGR